ncbi:L,D-transpeptidase [Pseudomonas sp. GX19020]|uniref:L,D-transpeptidase n=1 Tax=Pseudomonadota TaxID=1224 RepID=UPI000896D337|nr:MULTISPECIES: L,D-transpeptidase [Pseudomonadota]MCL4068509.1 L,D-transpeptidase [Pseudomonas sp. GX19020]SEB44471.1 L,D-transpeptidase catalytic domain [Rhodobacter sp. 24-YEA-8]
MSADHLNRRRVLGNAAALGAAALGASAFGAATFGTGLTPAMAQDTPRNNASSFRMLDWRGYFDNTRKGAILVDITSRALHFWSEDQSVYRLYPTSVPLSDDLTRLGRTEVVQKVVNPSWRPTPSMKERNPEWPDVVEGGAADNPLGTRAMYLSWTYYRIHGTHDTRKIGRKSSNGCIGMYNEHVQELYDMAQIGTQVLLI